MKIALTIGCLFLFGMNPPEEMISYRKLTWSDFRGKVPNDISRDINAKTYLKFYMSHEEIDGHFTFNVHCYFLPEISFIVERSSEAVLQHEQTHFAIGEIMAILCERELLPLQGGDSTACQKARSIFSKYVEKKEYQNGLFDFKTEGGENEVEERLWEMKYLSQVHDLEKLADSRRGGKKQE